MTQLTYAIEKPLQDLYKVIEDNYANPSAAFYTSMNALETVSEGEVSLFDATNPTVMLLEASSVGTSAAVNKNISLLRKQYEDLAESSKDLYYHMSDWDYVNRFASPCTEPITILIGLNSLLTNMVRDEDEKCSKAIIPRDTEIVVGNIPFTLMYPIVMRKYDTGNLVVSYDAEIKSEFQSLETNIIQFEVRKMPDGTQFLSFQVPVMQLKITSVNGTIQAGRVFMMDHEFEDQFYYCRAFLRNTGTQNTWKEIKTTHSDLVYDQRVPTMVLEVDGSVLTAKLPQIYTVDGSLLGEVMLLVYTTKGNIIENLEPYDTRIELNAFNTERDLTVYTTQALIDVPRQAIATTITSGGTDGLDFEKLRNRVIFNSTGPQQYPITNTNKQADAENRGFTLVKNTDVVTNRIFLANQKLPAPINPRLITAANIGVETFVADRDELLNHPFIKINQNRWTLTPKCLWKQDNGILNLLSPQELQNLEAMEITAFVNHMNTNRYLYTPFHWVMDNDSLEFSLRPYYLDKPEASTINFISQNQTLQLLVNTQTRTIKRTETGYQLKIRVVSGNFYKALPDHQVQAQLMFYPDQQNLPVYILGSQSLSSNGEREFTFDINTNYDFDSEHRINIVGVDVHGNYAQDVWANLDTEFHIFLCTSSKTADYLPNEANDLYGDFQLSAGMVPITHESVKLKLGYNLKYLWSRARNIATGYDYKTHTEDVPLLYEHDVYEEDPVTGLIFEIVNGKPEFKKAHLAGEPALDSNGEPLYLYRKGEPIIDPSTGFPEMLPEKSRYKEVDILMIDGRHYFVNDKAYVAYNQEVIDILLSWITEDLSELNKRLLDQTKIYYHPKSQMGQCIVDRGDGITLYIEAEQSPSLELFVPEIVFKDSQLRQQLQNKAIKIMDEMLSTTEINNSGIEDRLIEVFGNAVTSLKLSGLGQSYDLHYARVQSPTKQLSLKRILSIQADGTLIMVEDVNFVFQQIKD